MAGGPITSVALFLQVRSFGNWPGTSQRIKLLKSCVCVCVCFASFPELNGLPTDWNKSAEVDCSASNLGKSLGLNECSQFAPQSAGEMLRKRQVGGPGLSHQIK